MNLRRPPPSHDSVNAKMAADRMPGTATGKMMSAMGCLTGPADRSEDAELLVDTGLTLLVLPRSMAERRELVARRSQQVLIAGADGPRGLPCRG